MEVLRQQPARPLFSMSKGFGVLRECVLLAWHPFTSAILYVAQPRDANNTP